jgi:hypothetical protein
MDQRPSMIDPYRTLGLAPGAPMAEVKRAYRRLAKAFHPDSAGEAALPRFLAIHEAYEAIRTGRPMAPGRRAASTSTSTSNPTDGAPWRADPDRARAAREQARRRAGAAGAGAGTTSGASGPRSTGTSGTRGKPGPSGSSGSSGRTGSGREGGGPGAGRAAGGGSRGGRRHVRKATLGSTSYDEARDPRDPNDPSWSGAAWYGPSTGEYWIINPREYADPRKHGPEYQSRARRMAEAAAAGAPMDAEADLEPEAVAGAEFPGEDDGPAVGAAAASRPKTNASARRADPRSFPGRAAEHARPAGRAEPLARPERPRSGWQPAARSRSQGATWALDPRSIRADARSRGRRTLPRDLIGGPADDPIRRLGIALVAWPPIGLAAAAAIGDVTGCAVYSADCGGTEPLLPWLAQAVILGLLLLLPPVARVLAGGAIGVLFALVPLTAFLVAVGGTGAPQAGFALAFMLALAWLVGVAWAIALTRRRSVARAGP